MQKHPVLGIEVMFIFILTSCSMPSTQVPDIPVKVVETEASFTPVAGTLMMWIDFSWFAYVPTGAGIIGHDEPVTSDHSPAYALNVDGFWIQQSEVSNRQYLGCVSAGVCTPPAVTEDTSYWFGRSEFADYPVTGVTWQQAEDYCTWIYARLPKEAEWEIAARGMHAATYPWGETDSNCDLANSAGCADPAGPLGQGSLPDGKGPYNALDMTGNVREWVKNWYVADWYPGALDGPADGTQRVVRGGGFLTSEFNLQTWLREALEPEQFAPDLGFRCALDDRSNPVSPSYCQIPPVVGEIQPPLIDPLPTPEFRVNGFCAVGVTGVVAVVPEGDDPNNYIIIGPQGILNCDIGDDRQACWGPGLVEDTTVTIRICPDCPPGFTYDFEMGKCRHLAVGPIDPKDLLQLDCPDGYVQVDGLGCVLNESPECPEGELYIPDSGCVPVWPTETTCSQGYVWSDGCGCILEGLACVVDASQVGQVEDNTQVGQVEDNTQVGQVDDNTQTGYLAVCEPSPMPNCGADTILTQVNADCWACLPWDPGTNDGFNPPSFFDVFTEFEPGNLQPGKAPELLPEQACTDDTEPPVCNPGSLLLKDTSNCWFCMPWFDFWNECQQGSYYDAQAGCCIPDAPLPQSCPEGYAYDALLHACIPAQQKPGCIEIQVYIPVCEAPTSVPHGCTNPSQYGNQSDCAAENCKWVYTAAGAGYCTNP